MENLDLSVFPEVSREEWLQLAQNQLKGEDPMALLKWDSSGISDLGPYYDSSDVETLQYLNHFFSKIKPHRWKLYEHIKVDTEKEANKVALEALTGGCDGIIFSVDSKLNSGLLLEKIDQNICDISIISSEVFDANNTSFTIRKTPDTSNCIFASQKPESAVAQILEVLDLLKSEEFIYRPAFSDFFVEIATVRALRYMVEVVKEKRAHIHTEIMVHPKEDHQWFLNTTAGIATILGGSHSVEFTTTGDSRISRNTGNLIREESKIENYEDQCGGSYLVEVLTDKIIQEVKKDLK